MSNRILLLLAVLCATSTPGVVSSAAAQNRTSDAGKWEVPRTPDGHPDLQGNWTNMTLTPFERAEGRGPVFTLDEVQELERPDGVCPANPGTVACGRPERTTGSAEVRLSGQEYNEVYWDRGSQVAIVDGEPRASLVTSPANGRRPPLTPEGERRVQESLELTSQFGPYDHPELRPLGERCVINASTSNPAGPPMVPKTSYKRQLHNRTDGRSRDDHGGDDPRHADYQDRIGPTAAPTRPSVVRRLLGSLGRRRTRGRDHEHQSTTGSPWSPPLGAHEGDRTFHSGRRRDDPLRVHRRGSDDVHPTLGRRDSDQEISRQALRVRLPRGQLQSGGCTERRALSRENGSAGNK